MRTPMAALGSSAFFAAAPGVVAGVIPWAITGWEICEASPAWWPLRVAGALLIAAGVSVLVAAFIRFVAEGRGTPAPIAPTERLVVGGLYRYVRNPMYLAVLATIVGQALALWQWSLLWYAAVVCVAFVSFVRGYEEPALARQFGDDYIVYKQAVPAWRPRLQPWHPTPPGRPSL